MIYFDNSATTRICEEALKTYVEVSGSQFGNPSSLHALGFEAERTLEDCRKQIRLSLGVRDGAIIFTSGGSESNNLAIFGRAYAKERYRRGAKILTTAGEHASVTVPLERLADEGYRVVYIPTKNGTLDMDVLSREMTSDVILVTMMMVNNETGACYDLAAVSQIMKRQSPEAVLHVDATQSYMKLAFTAASVGADMISVSSHKIEGPKGVGALYVHPDIITKRGLAARILGGGQEGGLRSGTENVPAIAAFATASSIALAHRTERIDCVRGMTESLIRRLREDARLGGVSVTEPPVRAPHIVNITLPGIKSETMLHFLSSKGICVSSGSACSSHGTHGSPALIAYGHTQAQADCSLRISLSHRNTEEEITCFLEALAEGVGRLSRMRRP